MSQPSMTPTRVSDFMMHGVSPDEDSTAEVMREALRAVREHLGMEVAFIAEFSGGHRVFRFVDAASDNPIIKPGDSNPLEESYCQRVVDGRLPQLMRDACQVPAALELPVTTALPVGAHLSVPIRLADGRTYGTFCCFSTTPDHSLRERDLSMLRMFADFSAKQIDRTLAANKARAEAADRIQAVIDGGQFSVVYQPIYHFEHDRITGFESLTRFGAQPTRSPDVWFNEAARVGLSVDLETLVIHEALRALETLPADVYLGLNASPQTILAGALNGLLESAPSDRVVIEVTEHAAIEEYAGLAKALKPLRDRGVKLAVDDAGAGYASFRHILELRPDLIKLDISLTRDIDSNASRRALAAALIRFAEETGSKIISEGVETERERAVLRDLGVCKAQGYLFGRPMPMAAAASLCCAQAGSPAQSVNPSPGTSA